MGTGTQVRVEAFNEQLLLRAFGDRATIRYLCAYLGDLGAASMLIEDRYVDRHFVDDFAAYYARSFSPPTQPCQRWHFFKGHDAQALQSALETAVRQRNSSSSAKPLQDKYLGNAVWRPLAGASLGRTVLKTYHLASLSPHEVNRAYRVNVLGVKLSIDGLAFQEQDQGAAVCASTALWSALQQVASIAGHRTPTPSAITAAADSPFPASMGLDWLQMAQAISRLGYVADWFVPANDHDLFRAQLMACLRSNLPALIILSQESRGSHGTAVAGHAVTVTGCDQPLHLTDVAVAALTDEPPIAMRGGGVRTVYVHDDNLGPHAHYELRSSTDKDELGNAKLMLFRGDSGRDAVDWWKPDEWQICGALVPKSPKMRTGIETLVRQILGVRPLVEQLLPGLGDLEYDVRFCAGTAYRDEIPDQKLDPAHLFDFHTRLSLPRHVGVVTIFREREQVIDFVLDISEVRRLPGPAILAIVAPGIAGMTPAASWMSDIAGVLV